MLSATSKHGTNSCKRLRHGRETLDVFTVALTRRHFDENKSKEDGKEGRNATTEKKKKIQAGRQKVAESRLASFLRNSVRQLREKLVLPLVGSGRCEGFEEGDVVWNTKGREGTPSNIL